MGSINFKPIRGEDPRLLVKSGHGCEHLRNPDFLERKTGWMFLSLCSTANFKSRKSLELPSMPCIRPRPGATNSSWHGVVKTAFQSPRDILVTCLSIHLVISRRNCLPPFAPPHVASTGIPKLVGPEQGASRPELPVRPSTPKPLHSGHFIETSTSLQPIANFE